MIRINFAPGTYTPVRAVNFVPPAIAVIECIAYGLLDDLSGNANGAVIHPFSLYRYRVAFHGSNYTPLSVAIFGSPGDLSGAGYGVLDDLTGVADCVSTSDQQGIGYGVLDDLTGVAQCQSIVNIGVGYGTLDDLVGSAQCNYDSNVPRHLTCKLTVDLQDGDSVSLVINANQQATSCYSLLLNSTAEAAQSIDIELSYEQAKTVFHSVNTCATTGQTESVSVTLNSPINLTQFVSLLLCDDKQDANAVADTIQSIQDVLIFTSSQTETKVEDCGHNIIRVIETRYLSLAEYTPVPVVNFSASNYMPLPVAVFNNSIRTEYLIEMTHGVVSLQITTTAGNSQELSKKTCSIAQMAIPPLPGKSIPHIGTRPKPNPQPPNHITYHIPIRETYAMQHTIIVKTVADNQALELKKISLSYDAESYAWQFSGTLAYIADLSRFNLTDFEPVQLSISIDGHVWLVVVEELPENKSFGKIEIQLTGRSLSALLGEPWSQINSYLQGSEMTVQQLADSLIPFDWTIDWQCPTWLLPANTYSHTQQSPLQSLKTIANNIGAVLYPVPDSKTLRVQPRYPVLPWNYNLSGMNPDVVIPDDAVLSMGIKSRVASPINGVYVHGTTADGILGRCVLSGTAGDVLAATESNSLITDVVGARALGERVLAGKYTQPTISTLTTFLGGDFPLFDVGMLVLANGEKATVTGVSIDVEFGTVRQHLTFGENMTNVYARFLSVLPKTPLLVGTVVSNYGENSIMSLIGGGVIAARGTGTVGQNYYVRNGVIETQAPNLTAFDIML